MEEQPDREENEEEEENFEHERTNKNDRQRPVRNTRTPAYLEDFEPYLAYCFLTSLAEQPRS